MANPYYSKETERDRERKKHRNEKWVKSGD